MNRSIIPLAVQLGCTAAVGGYLAVQLFRQRGWRWLAAALLLAAFGAAGALAGYGWLSLPVVCITAFLLVHLGDRLGTNRVSFRFAALFVLVQVGLCLLNQNGTAAQGSWTFSLLATAIFFLSENNQNFLRKSYEQSMMEYQNKVVAKQVEEVQGLYMTMRGWRHDYHNHIQVLKAHMAMGQLDALAGYLDALEQDLSQVDTYVKSGNLMVDAVLNSKLTLARQKDIALDCAAELPEQLSVSDVDLCVILGNLLDNAVEACEKIPPEGRFLRVYCAVVKHQLYLSVQNSAKEELDFDERNYISKKRGNHGLGMKRVKVLVDQYQGFLNLQNQPGIFAAEVLLPLTSPQSPCAHP